MRTPLADVVADAHSGDGDAGAGRSSMRLAGGEYDEFWSSAKRCECKGTLLWLLEWTVLGSEVVYFASRYGLE